MRRSSTVSDLAKQIDGQDATKHQEGHHAERDQKGLGAHHGSKFSRGDGEDFTHDTVMVEIGYGDGKQVDRGSVAVQLSGRSGDANEDFVQRRTHDFKVTDGALLGELSQYVLGMVRIGQLQFVETSRWFDVRHALQSGWCLVGRGEPHANSIRRVIRLNGIQTAIQYLASCEKS